MADVTYTLKATVRRAAADAIPGKGDGPNLKFMTVTRSVTARTANDTLKLARLPSNARLHGISRVHWDDIASSGAPTMDIGIAPVNDVNGAITADPDALNDGLDVAGGASNAAMIKDHANYGKMLWEHVSGLTADPGGLMDIYASFVDANTNVTGDVTAEIAYTVD